MLKINKNSVKFRNIKLKNKLRISFINIIHMKTSKNSIKFEITLNFFSIYYYHRRYIHLKISSHNGNRGYEIAITAFATITSHY